MTPARAARGAPLDERLLILERARAVWTDARIRDLPGHLHAGDLVVVNDAATLPASLRAGELEVRLLGRNPDGTFAAVLLGAGDWRTRTEDRPPPPPAPARLELEGGLAAAVVRVSPRSPRLLTLRFDADEDTLWPALARAGRPVQYSHLAAPLELWDVQNGWATRPWATEQPSAGRPLTWGILLDLRRRGVALASLTHACGLSATGDPAIDAALPLPERYDIPAATVAAVERAERVIAVGTSVVRALEGCVATHGRLVAGPGETDLRIGPTTELRVVDGLFTGLHEPGTSHFDLLEAFAPRPLLLAAYAHAEEAGYLGHELGDSSLIV